jgi:hypothetical protein
VIVKVFEHHVNPRHPHPIVKRDVRFDGVQFIITDRQYAGIEVVRRTADLDDLPLDLAVAAMARVGMDYAAAGVAVPMEVCPL